MAVRLTASGAKKWSGLTVLVTDDPGILTVKSRCFGMNVTTDVVAAAYEPVPGEAPPGWTADVIINVERAIESARNSDKWSPAKELALYLAHGIDHLCGGLDNTAKGRQTMRRRDLRWLREADRMGLVAPLLRQPVNTRRHCGTPKRHAD